MKMLCSVQLSKHRYKTPEGYLVCKDCIIARTGKQTYLKSELYGLTEGEDEYIDVDRKPNQVFDEKTLASFEGKPLTIEHPDVSVSPENYKNLSVGNVHNVRRGQFEGQDVMFADINVYDAEAINLIESGEMQELSCGYDCDITDGPNPEQINIRGNHVALCEQGRAGIARIQDSKKKKWGITPVKDSIGRGTLIQEFGKQGKQYKIVKINGNVIYAESLETERIVLFKKDEENVEWAIITKSEVKDSKRIKDFDLIDFEIIVTTNKPWKLTLWKIYNDIREKYGYGDREIFGNNWESGKLYLLPIVLEYGNVGDTEPERISIGPFGSQEEADSFVNKELNALIQKYKTDPEEVIKTEVRKDVIHFKDSISAFEVQVWKDGKKIDSKVAHSLEENKQITEEFEKKYGKDVAIFSEAVYTNDSVKDIKEEPRQVVWIVNNQEIEDVHKAYEEAKRLKKEKKLFEFTQLWFDEMGYPHTTDMRKNLKDSFAPLYVIALSEGSWLDENDRPTSNKEMARKFESEEAANNYKKIYCKGQVVQLNDNIVKDKYNLQEEIEPLKKLLQGIEYKKIESDPELNVIDIWFNDRKSLKRAGRKLVSLYDIELNDEDEDELTITIYDKYSKERGIMLNEDSAVWFSCNLRKGRPAEDFKQYLRDRGLYFEPSENGEFVHFEVKNADEDVQKEIKAINNHYEKVGLYDDYSKKFYIKAIKMLQDKLKKLEKNQLLDSNQEDYEIQKDKMIKEITKQIKEYQDKINEL